MTMTARGTKLRDVRDQWFPGFVYLCLNTVARQDTPSETLGVISTLSTHLRYGGEEMRKGSTVNGHT